MKIFSIVVFSIVGLWFVSSLFMDNDLESPEYSVLKKQDGFEIRSYEPYIIAEVTLPAGTQNPTTAAFRELGGYIFGGNQGDVSIAMTSPVSTSQEKGQSIAMTSPVAIIENNDSFTMSFSMPSKFSLENLPKPNSNKVSFRKVPAGTYATLGFTGWATDRQRLRYTEKLKSLLKAQLIEPLGEPELLQYDRPTKFPLLRRNEIKIEIAN